MRPSTQRSIARHEQHEQRRAARAERRAEILAELIEIGAALARAAAEAATAEIVAAQAAAQAAPLPQAAPASQPRAAVAGAAVTRAADPACPPAGNEPNQPGADAGSHAAAADIAAQRPVAPKRRPRPNLVRDFERLCAATSRTIALAAKLDAGDPSALIRRRAIAKADGNPALRRARLHAILKDMSIEPDELVQVMAEFIEDYCAGLEAEGLALAGIGPAAGAAAPDDKAASRETGDDAPIGVAPPAKPPAAAAPPDGVSRIPRRTRLMAQTSLTVPQPPWLQTG